MDNQQNSQKKSNPKFDFGVITEYVFLTFIFWLIIFIVNEIVLLAVVNSGYQINNKFISLNEVHNTGAAFNLFAGQTQIIIIASAIAILLMATIVIIFSTKIKQFSISSISMLSAGIIMNMVQRIQLGYVVDYINFNLIPNFPVFNTADIMIVFGALGLILALFSKNQD